MSWISGFADKAEQFLVKIDEGAASKLQKKKSVKSVQEDTLTEVTSDPTPTPQKSKPTPPPSPAKRPSLPQLKPSASMVKHSHEEEKLIDFLNDNTRSSSEDNGVETNYAGFNPRTEGIQNEDEKQMLKNEVRVLNNELSLLLHRTRAAEKESESFKLALQDAERSRLNLEDDLNKLKTKLKSLEQNNHLLLTEKNNLEERSSKSPQIEQLQRQIQSLQEQQSNLSQRLERKAVECERLQESREAQQQEAEALSTQLAELRSELEQYRARAQRTLSDKEALISQLRANSSATSIEASFHTELKQLREERQALVEEQQQTSGQLEVGRRRLAEVEQTLERVRESAAHTQQQLQERVASETHKRRIIEDDYRIQSQELRLAREEAGQLNACLREKEAEVGELRSQLSSRPASPPVHLLPGELETRLSSLTKTLIQKQTTLESATTERNQLRMQLEELEHKYRESLVMLHQARVIGANDTDDAKAQVPSFMVESPFDTGVARRVKRVYSSLDAVSIRTGVFLRRYPLARILVILYVVVLHLLVLLVLYSRTPDNAQE